MNTTPLRVLLVPALLLSLVAAAPVPEATTALAPRPTLEVHYVPTVQDAVIRVEIQRDASLDEAGQAVLLTYSPYNSLGDATSLGDFTVANDSMAGRYNRYGIARAYADVLGTRGSTGCWDYGGLDEQQSGVDVVNFLSGLTEDVDGNRLAWTNGNVGMTGVSYEGTTANMVAAAGDRAPGLKAVIPIAAISHWYGYAYFEGVRYLGNSESATDEGFDTPLAFDHGFGDTVHPDNPDSVTARAAECGAVEHEQQAYSRTPDYTEFWQQRDYSLDTSNWHAATLIVHGWNDYNVKQDEGLRLYEALPVDDPETPEVEGAVEKRLWMTQSTHANGNGAGYQELVDDFWFTHLLGDAEAAERLAAVPPVRTLGETFQGAAPEPTFAPAWPLPGTATHSLFLNRTYEQDIDGVAVPGPGTGEVGELSYRNRYEGPTDGRAGSYGPESSWLDTLVATEELSRNDPWSNDGNPGEGPGGQGYYSLAFQTPPLATDVHIAGRSVLDGVFRFYQGAGATITPILVEISPSGSYKTVQRGFLNVDYRDGLGEAAPAPATGEWVRAAVTFLPEDYTVAAGNRLGVILQSSNSVWAVPGNPAGLVSVGLGPVDGLTDTGTRLHLPLVDAPERIFDEA